MVLEDQPSAGRTRAYVSLHLPALRRDDHRRRVPVLGTGGRSECRPARGRRCRGARRERGGSLRLTQRRVGAAPCGHQCQRGGADPQRIGFRRQPHSTGLRASRTDHRGVRPDRRCDSARAGHSHPRQRCGDRSGHAATRRHRAASSRSPPALQRCDHSRNPPPGEEQLADHLVAASSAGPSSHVT